MGTATSAASSKTARSMPRTTAARPAGLSRVARAVCALGEGGVARFVGGDAAHARAQLGVLGVLGLVASEQRSKRLAHATLDGVLECDREQLADGDLGDFGSGERSAAPCSQAADDVRMANFVGARFERERDQLVWRSVMRELAGQALERDDARRLQVCVARG